MCFGSEPPLDVRSVPVLIAWGNLTFLECTDRCEVITSLIPTVASSVIFCRKRELNLGEKVDTAKPNTPPLGMYGRPFHPAERTEKRGVAAGLSQLGAEVGRSTSPTLCKLNFHLVQGDTSKVSIPQPLLERNGILVTGTKSTSVNIIRTKEGAAQPDTTAQCSSSLRPEE